MQGEVAAIHSKDHRDYPYSRYEPNSSSISMTNSTKTSESNVGSSKREKYPPNFCESIAFCSDAFASNRRTSCRTADDSGRSMKQAVSSTWRNQSSVPHFGQVASPNKDAGSTQTSDRQIGQWFGCPSGVREEISILKPILWGLRCSTMILPGQQSLR